MAPRVLLVEDEPDLARTVAYGLKREGFDVTIAATGRAALEATSGPLPFDAVVLDLMLPDLGGLEVCRRLRADTRTRNLPILMATARGEEIDRVVGFEIGADDYVVKPYSVRELSLRIKALLRRVEAVKEPEGMQVAGPFRVDVPSHTAWLDDVPLPLTTIELKLLAFLMSRRGRVQSRQQLLDGVWAQGGGDITDRTVDAHVKRMRDKCGAAGAWIQTVRGVGYRFAEAPDDEDVS